MATADSPTIQDVRNAVQQAQLRRRTFSYKGSFRETRHADILQEHNQQQIERGLRDGSLSEDDIPRLSNIMLDNSEQSFRVWESDGACFRYEHDGTICTYDGELYRHVDRGDQRGRTLRTSREDALTDRNTIDNLLSTRGLFFTDLFAADNVAFEIMLSERNFPGTSTVLQVQASKENEPTLFTDVYLDTERDFWPLEIHSYAVWTEPDGSRTQYNDTKVVINRFHHTDGCFIPASLHKSRFLYLIEEGRDVEHVGIEETLDVTDVKVNQPLNDQLFTIEFPDPDFNSP